MDWGVTHGLACLEPLTVFVLTESTNFYRLPRICDLDKSFGVIA